MATLADVYGDAIRSYRMATEFFSRPLIHSDEVDGTALESHVSTLMAEAEQAVGLEPKSFKEIARSYGRTLQGQAVWAQSGLPVFRLTHGLVAALLMTDTDDVPLSEVRFPYPAFLIQFPGPDYLMRAPQELDGGFDVTNLLVHERATVPDWESWRGLFAELLAGSPEERERVADDGEVFDGYMEKARERLHAEYVGERELNLAFIDLDYMDAHLKRREILSLCDRGSMKIAFSGRHVGSTVGDYLDQFHSGTSRHSVIRETNGEWRSQSAEWLSQFHTLGRLLVNLALYLTARTEDDIGHKVRAKSVKLHDSAFIEPKVWVVGQEVKIPKALRDAVGDAVRRGHARAPWKVEQRFIVRGHFRNQACGPGFAERRRTWIQPYWKGPESTGVAMARTFEAQFQQAAYQSLVNRDDSEVP